MSLEQAIQENTAAVRELISVWGKLTAQAVTVDKAPADTKVEAAGKSVKAAPEKAKPAAEPTAPAASAASTASTPEAKATVDYPTLQKAVLSLASKSREAAMETAAGFGVKTFKELPEAKWAAALDAVNAKLAELEVA